MRLAKINTSVPVVWKRSFVLLQMQCLLILIKGADARDALPSVQLLQFSCSFWKKIIPLVCEILDPPLNYNVHRIMIHSHKSKMAWGPRQLLGPGQWETVVPFPAPVSVLD